MNPELTAILDSYAADLSKGTTTSYFENTILTQYFGLSYNGGTWIYTSGGNGTGKAITK